MSEMSIMGREGDTKLFWDSANTPEVENARETFERLVGEGYLAFSAKKSGKKGKRISEFDPYAARIILVPPVMGG